MATVNQYHSKYCKEIIEHCEKGYSVESFAAKIKKSPGDILLWAQNHPDFLEAIKQAICQERYYWEHELLNALNLNEDTSKLNAIKSRVESLSGKENSMRVNLFQDIIQKDHKLYSIAPTDKDVARELAMLIKESPDALALAA